MSVWFTKSLGDAMLAGEALDQIKTLFLSEYDQVLSEYDRAERRKEMAIFFRHESEGRLHCELKIYLTPTSVLLAEQVDAIPCERPSPQGLSLLAGAEESWSAFSPGTDI